ncbi:helix-turn-helix transcriptional regulator [Thermophilibacter sp.]
MNVEIAQRLAELRRAKGYSQESLAHELGLSRQAVSKWERAESSPDTENLIALARLYGVSLDELLRVGDDIKDDVAFENAERAGTRDEAEAERRADRETATQAAQAAAEASRAAAQAAEAATQASRHVARASAEGGRGERGRWRSFPYATCMVALWLVLTLFGGAPFSFLVFFTIPVYRWLAGIMDEAERRADERDEAEGRA